MPATIVASARLIEKRDFSRKNDGNAGLAAGAAGARELRLEIAAIPLKNRLDDASATLLADHVRAVRRVAFGTRTCANTSRGASATGAFDPDDAAVISSGAGTDVAAVAQRLGRAGCAHAFGHTARRRT